MQYKTTWKETYSYLSQANKRILNENAGTLEGVFSNMNDMRNEYSNYISYMKKCDEDQTLGNCWESGTVNLHGDPLENNAWWNDNAGLVLNNGSFVLFDYRASDCTNNDWGTPLGKTVCGMMYVDVNGSDGPNRAGKDVYWVHVTKDNIYPVGTFGDGREHTCIPDNSGLGCSAKYLLQ